MHLSDVILGRQVVCGKVVDRANGERPVRPAAEDMLETAGFAPCRRTPAEAAAVVMLVKFVRTVAPAMVLVKCNGDAGGADVNLSNSGPNPRSISSALLMVGSLPKLVCGSMNGETVRGCDPRHSGNRKPLR